MSEWTFGNVWECLSECLSEFFYWKRKKNMKIIVIILLRQLNHLKTIKTTVFVLNYMFFVGQRVDFECRKIVENSRKSERLGTFGNFCERLSEFFGNFWGWLGIFEWIIDWKHKKGVKLIVIILFRQWHRPKTVTTTVHALEDISCPSSWRVQ